MNPAWIEMRLALIGAVRLARGDRSGLSCFVASIDGFWRSFRAAAICYPLYLLLLSLRTSEARFEAAGFDVVIIETIAYAISWVGFPLLVLPLTRLLGRDHHFLRFMVAYNWCQVPQTVLFVLLALAGGSGALPVSAAQFADLFGALAVLIYEWFVAKVALDLPGPRAALIVLADVALGTLLTHVSEALY